MTNNKLNYILELADDALILGHRLSEWCGHGPILEQDIALTNISLDHLGRARSLYQYAAAIFNEMPAAEKNEAFASIALAGEVSAGVVIDEDDLAYLRDGWDFRNCLLVEQPNGDWAYTVARSFFYDVFDVLLLASLLKSSDTTIAAVAEKSLKEATYHLRWSSEWVVRLGDGTEESKTRMQQAINDTWVFTGELFMTSKAEAAAAQQAYGTDPASLKSQWHQQVSVILGEATLQVPAEGWMQQGGREGNHSEHLGYVLAEMQYMQRTYPGMEW